MFQDMNPLGRTKKAATPRSGARNIKWTNEVIFQSELYIFLVFFFF